MLIMNNESMYIKVHGRTKNQVSVSLLLIQRNVSFVCGPTHTVESFVEYSTRCLVEFPVMYET